MADFTSDDILRKVQRGEKLERADLRRFLETYIPRALGPELYTKTCLYTLTPDRDFVIDTLPQHPQIAQREGNAAYRAVERRAVTCIAPNR